MQPGGPACRKVGGVMGSIVQEPACAGEYPEGGGGFYGSPAAVKEAAFLCRAMRRCADCGGTPHWVSGRWAHGLWPCVGRLLAVNATATKYWTGST
jgi:hypothetical protein